MKSKRTIMTIAAMMLICVVSVAGTLAYLTMQSEDVENTFAAVGLAKVFKLDESKANKDQNDSTKYVLDTTNRVQANSYDVYANVDIPKDPMVTIEDLKQDAYLFVAVDDKTAPVITWAMDSNWVRLPDKSNSKGDIYAYKNTISKADGLQTFMVMKQDYASTGVSMNVGDFNTENAPTNATTLNFYAYLAQAAGFANAADAWDATFGADA